MMNDDQFQIFFDGRIARNGVHLVNLDFSKAHPDLLAALKCLSQRADSFSFSRADKWHLMRGLKAIEADDHDAEHISYLIYCLSDSILKFIKLAESN